MKHHRPFSHLFVLLFMMPLLFGCAMTRPVEPAPLPPVEIIVNESPFNYKYVFINYPVTVIANAAPRFSDDFGRSGQVVVPGDVIAGRLIKEGFIKLYELNPNIIKETLIVNYGEVDLRSSGIRHTAEVVIQFISAESNTLICSCNAEDRSLHETESVRRAISKCLDALLTSGEGG